MSMFQRQIRISIVIPSYNQARYLESCIESILQQNYPDLEIIIMDGGSKDGSAKIIKKYMEHFTYWQSQPDGGQVSAIVSGFERATGELLTWLNSDDILLPGALELSATAIKYHEQADVLYGDHVVIDNVGTVVERYKHPRYYNKLAWLTMPYIAQPGTIFTRRIWEKVGRADTDMHCAFDYDLWYRFMAADAKFIHVGGSVSGFRRHAESKGSTWLETYKKEHEMLRERYREHWGTPWQRKAARLALMAMQMASGAYIYSLTYRIINHHKISAYES